MDDLLSKIGLSQKELTIYKYLLKNSQKSAVDIAKNIKESRTNTYMLLTKLIDKNLVIVNDDTAVRKYNVANPKTLESTLKLQQQEIANTRHALNTFMPELISTFNLSQQRPGVVNFEGYEGLKTSFEDQSKSKTDLLVWASDVANKDPKIWQLIEKGGYQRRIKGIKTKALFHSDAANWPHLKDFAAKNFEVRLWGDNPFMGEVLIYDNKVTITTLAPEVVVTVITNQTIADTFRTIFNNCWEQAIEI